MFICTDGGGENRDIAVYVTEPPAAYKVHLLDPEVLLNAVAEQSWRYEPEMGDDIDGPRHLQEALEAFCGRTTFGPFTPSYDVDALDEDAVCGVCLRTLNARRSGED